MVSDTEIRLQNLLLCLSNYSQWYLLFSFFPCYFLASFLWYLWINPTIWLFHIRVWGAGYNLTEWYYLTFMMLYAGWALSVLWCFYLSLVNFPSHSLNAYLLNLCPLSPHCLSPTLFLSDVERRVPNYILFNIPSLSPTEMSSNLFHSHLLPVIPLPRPLGILPTTLQIPLSLYVYYLSHYIPQPMLLKKRRRRRNESTSWSCIYF